MSLVWRPGFQFDADASTYIEAVEVADGQALETATRYAINNFVIGCKQDGIWDAIKASCILAGARTLAGALVPLVGTAPTNNGPFVSGDYNRKTGLDQGGSGSKWLDSNYSNTADSRQNNNHQAVFSTKDQGNVFYAGNDYGVTGSTALSTGGTSVPASRNMTASPDTAFTGNAIQSGKLFGSSRNSSSSYLVRVNSTNFNVNTSSESPSSGTLGIFRLSATPSFGGSNLRIAFYSIGESLDLALLDSRVTDLITAFGAAIP